MQPEMLVAFAFIIIIAAIMIFYYSRQKRPVKTALLGGISGIISLFLAKVAFRVFGVAFPFTPISLCISGFLGIPGVLLLCAMQLFLI